MVGRRATQPRTRALAVCLLDHADVIDGGHGPLLVGLGLSAAIHLDMVVGRILGWWAPAQSQHTAHSHGTQSQHTVRGHSHSTPSEATVTAHSYSTQSQHTVKAHMPPTEHCQRPQPTAQSQHIHSTPSSHSTRAPTSATQASISTHTIEPRQPI